VIITQLQGGTTGSQANRGGGEGAGEVDIIPAHFRHQEFAFISSSSIGIRSRSRSRSSIVRRHTTTRKRRYIGYGC